MKKWVKVGLVWGIWMFLGITFIKSLIFGEVITLKVVIIESFLWMIAGLLYGYISDKYKLVKTKFKK